MMARQGRYTAEELQEFPRSRNVSRCRRDTCFTHPFRVTLKAVATNFILHYSKQSVDRQEEFYPKVLAHYESSQ